MSKSVDISGTKFGRLTAQSIDHNHRGQEYWLCTCECGGTNIVRKSHLTSGRIRSCGCMYHGQKRGVSGPNTYEVAGDTVYGTDFKGNGFTVDSADLVSILPYRWYLNHDGYVVARIDGKNVTMHRFLLGDDAETIDHQNHDKTDNRRSNLRQASNSENISNRMESYVGKPVIGVYQHGRSAKYEALVIKDGQRHSLGFFDKYFDAARARLLGEITYFGDFAPQKHLFAQYGITEEELNV